MFLFRRRMSFALASFALSLAACGGGGDNGAGAAPADTPAENSARSAANSEPAANSEGKREPDASDKPLVLAWDAPQGWTKLRRSGVEEVFPGLKGVDGISVPGGVAKPKPPGETEPQEAFDEWLETSSRAALVQVEEKPGDPGDALRRAGKKLFAGFQASAVRAEEELTVARFDSDRMMLIALQNEKGVYVIILHCAQESRWTEDGEAMIRWAKTIKAERPTD